MKWWEKKVGKPEMKLGGDPTPRKKPVGPIYVTDPNDPRLKAYNDSLSLYNNYQKEFKRGMDFMNEGTKVYNENKYFWEAPSQGFGAHKIPLGRINSTSFMWESANNDKIKPISSEKWTTRDADNNIITEDNEGRSYRISGYKEPVQPVVYQQAKPKAQDLSEKNLEEYNKKYPPIYLEDPNDPRIGGYAEKGNAFLYKKPVPQKPSYQQIPTKTPTITPIQQSIDDELRTSFIEPAITFPKDLRRFTAANYLETKGDSTGYLNYGDGTGRKPQFQNGGGLPQFQLGTTTGGQVPNMIPSTAYNAGPAWGHMLPEVRVEENMPLTSQAYEGNLKRTNPIAYAAIAGPGKRKTAELLTDVTSVMPGIGDVQDGMELARAIKDKDYGTLRMAAAATAIPFVGYGAFKQGKKLWDARALRSTTGAPAVEGPRLKWSRGEEDLFTLERQRRLEAEADNSMNDLPPPPVEQNLFFDPEPSSPLSKEDILRRELDEYTERLIDHDIASTRSRNLEEPFDEPAPEFVSAEFPNMSYSDARSRMDNLAAQRRHRQRIAERSMDVDAGGLTYTTFGKPVVRNKSGYTKEELLQVSKNKETVQSMEEDAFKNTVLKPNGEVVPYNTESLEPYFSGKNNVNMIPVEEYTSRFNDNIERWNTIIADKNTSGVAYRATGLTPNGALKFEAPSIPGTSIWNVGINPGEWRGEVEDVVDANYLKSVPGLQMRGSSGSVFPDGVSRKGSRAYESLNEYLKELGLGRVSSGFNSQTPSSAGVWDNLVNSGRAVGYKAGKGLTYGTMKTAIPAAGLGKLMLQEKKEEFKLGGPATTWWERKLKNGEWEQ